VADNTSGGVGNQRRNGSGFTDDAGKTEFAYAHPLFWAPYSIIGDGGRR
jgi:hypothetical protein